MTCRRFTFYCVLVALLGWAVVERSANAQPRVDRFDAAALDAAWQVSRVLSQGPGAEPQYRVSDGRLTWSYSAGTSHAQQHVLLRDDVLPAIGEAVQVRLFPAEFPRDEHDFAGLALSNVGPSLQDRVGLLIFYFEPAAGQLKLWHFATNTEQPTVQRTATLDIGQAKTLVLRLLRLGERQICAAWSTDGERFRWLPPIGFGPVRAVGVYHGNARSPQGTRLSMDDFRVFPAAAPQLAADYAETTPSWTHPDGFLLGDGRGGDCDWPAVRAEARPGAYWWWPGSGVTKQDLTWNLATYRRAGWGNMGVIGIYGVQGEEHRFIDIFSPKWFEMFNHAVAEGERLGMNIDLTPSAGWCMGGPHVTPRHAELSFRIEQGKIVSKHTGKQVERAGPGGVGLSINPYSRAAVAFHLDWMDQCYEQGAGVAPRAFYYDSFENPGNWCPELLDTFRARRGYALEDHVEALAGQGDADRARRVVCDYRETLSDLLLQCVDDIARWGARRGSGLRMQAHGSPANLLDMYAAATIPETEVFGASRFGIPGFRRDPQWIRPDRQSDLVNRFASSAAHVAGRNLVISESFTWLRNHYHASLAQIKAESDKLLLNGINCIYYHGICYAPKETAWPGWLFYASTQANVRNSIFRDVPALNAYLTRCQSVLQNGRPHNDVLLYWPVYDLWMTPGRRELRFSVHHPEWIDDSACGHAGRWMIDRGHTFDFVSDRQLLMVACRDGTLTTVDGRAYQAVLAPAVQFMKLETAKQLTALAEAGATVLVWKHLPLDVPGWSNVAARKEELQRLLGRLSFGPDGVAAVGRGKIVVSDDLATLMQVASVEREPMVDRQLQFIRRKCASHVAYFVVNHSAETIDGWTPLATPVAAALLMDPMTGRIGRASLRTADGRTEVYLHLLPGETRVLRAFDRATIAAPDWVTLRPSGDPIPVAGTWQVEFIEGGPALPASFSTDELKCWTALGDAAAQRFAGAARYSITVDVPAQSAPRWFLDLGDVRETARVWINGRPAGIAVAHPFRVDVSGLLKVGANDVAIEVTNLSANRIRDLDARGVAWKKFYDINFVSHMYRPFDAAEWDAKPSGLLGPVALVPHDIVEARVAR